MTMNTVPSQFLKLPDDILLEILAQLPAFQVVLRCRLVCRKIDQLSREQHLWIQFSRRAERMPCPRLDLEKIRAPEFEANICRIEMLEEKWGDEDALLVAPRFWRKALTQDTSKYFTPQDCVALMGANIVVLRKGVLNWVPTQNINGPPLCSLSLPDRDGCWFAARYCNLMTSTLYLAHYLPEQGSLKIVGIQANLPQGPQAVVAEDSFPLRGECIFCPACDGFLSVHYFWPLTTRLEIDIIDLEEKTLTRLSLPLLGLIDSHLSFPPDTFATENYVMEICGHQWFAIFDRPIHSYDARQSNTDIRPLPLEAIALDPLLGGSFPWPIHHIKHVIPRSATSFAVVVIRTEPITEIHMFLFTTSDTGPIFEDICSVGISSGCCNFVLPVPLPTSQYALGVLGFEATSSDEVAASEEVGVRKHFTVRIDFPNSKGDPTSSDRGGLTVQRMPLTPAVNEREEYAEARFFDCLTGRVLFSVSSLTDTGVSNLVLDYLSMS